MNAEDLKVGDVVEFDFGQGTKEGTVVQRFGKSLYLKVDFPNHNGKIIRRKIHDLNREKGAKKGKRKK